ncbi:MULTISPECIES: DNA helicase [unclassified Devosia]|uniref:DNA helicase n=1 Tax=unclassified Devosia TaxID=196773 RepID=UPI00086D606D|nr:MULTISPECIES: DNA helicase [unclassified Devosia]MBN9363966.1 AAA family ATPase [Devosia sp.]ODS83392.1 MAG: DNA helicase [Devosia sp. SCN 66-27]OJX27230.1 MAG: DNA helicase [Devosia sp. 66-14]
MKLSVPIYQLKREAKRLAREGKIPLSAALDRVAAAEGFSGWSLLAARYAESSPAAKLYGRLQPGELVLVGARPGQGKTLLALELAAEAAKSGGQGMFFTLEYTDKDVLDRLRAIGREPAELGDRFGFDCSDRISAAYIIEKMATAPRGTLVVVDYLQLLDQRRENPPLAEQVRALKAFAEARGLVIVFISQIDRSYDPAEKPYPDARDIRLPNPVDLELFSKSWFLNNGEISLQAAG